MSAIGINQQIDWVEGHITDMEKRLPGAVIAGRTSLRRAEERMALAKATLNTLIQLKRLIQGEEPKP